MKASNDLHQLIHSLSKAEKRFFRIHASRYTSQDKNNYTLLFDFIEQQEDYDEGAVKHHFKGETFIKHLPSEKNYLYNLILDTLHICYSEASEDQKIKKRLHQALLLSNRGQVAQSMRILKKLKQKAVQSESYNQLLDIIQLEKQLISRNYYTGSSLEELEKLYEEEKEYSNYIHDANDYWYLFSQFYHIHYSSGASRNAEEWQKIEKIMQHPLLKDVSRTRTFKTRLDFLHIHALYHFVKGEPEKAFSYNYQYLQVLESRPDNLQQYSKRYLASLNNYMMDSLNLEKYEEVERGIAKMRALPESFGFYNTLPFRADIFRLSTILELNLYIKTGQYHEGYRQMPAIREGLSLYENQMVKHSILTLYYMLAYIAFGADKPAEAIRWLNRIINDTEENILTDIQAFARIFSLIVHYELQNFDILEYLFVSTYRYLSTKNKFYKAESILLRHMRKFAGMHNDRRLQKAFEKLKTELLPLTQDTTEKKAFEYFDIISWLDSKIHNKPFAAAVAEKIQSTPVAGE